jgi:hypothetical protein
MRLVCVLSRVLEHTESFLKAVAGTPGASLKLVRGDRPPDEVLQLVRIGYRMWFEGTGPLLTSLMDRGLSWASDAVLRVGEEEVATLPLPGLWGVVSDLIVPSRRAAEAVARAAPVPPRRRVRVVPPTAGRQGLGAIGGEGAAEPLTFFGEVLATSPGDMCRRDWERLMTLGDSCRGDVLVLGDMPPECLDYLRTCLGIRAFTDPAALPRKTADTVIFWEGLRYADAERKLEDGLRYVAPTGKAVAIGPWYPESGEMTGLPLNDCLRMAIKAHDFGPALAAGDTGDSAGAPNPGLSDVLNDRPFVSVVIPVYNDEDVIGRCIAGLQRQTYPNLEIVVVDDGSTDGTRQAIAQHLNDPRVRYFYKEHTGTPGTRNVGVREARGEWIAWSGSDDQSSPNRMAVLVEAALANPEADILHSDGFHLLPEGRLHRCRRYQSFTAEELPSLLLAGFAGVCPILDASAMIRRSVYERIGLYNVQFPRAQDYDFYIRAALAGDVRFHHVPQPLIRFPLHLPRPHLVPIGLERYTELALKLIAACGEERLTPRAARDLHESSLVAMARELLSIGYQFQAPLDHPVFREAERYLDRASALPDARARALACSLRGLLAAHGGDGGRAAELMRQALTLSPGLVEAEMNLKALGSKDRTDDNLVRTARA